MNRKIKIGLLVLLFVVLAFGATLLLQGINVEVLNPKGWVGAKQRDLLVWSTYLMLLIVIPVFVLTLYIVTKYKKGRGTKYEPNWDYSLLAESLWWGLPFVIVTILSVWTWTSSHQLDPFKPLSKEVSNVKPIRIQVVALQWKWLFIYPEEKIAVVNFVQFPEKTPVNFEITSDAPMNSFWIPQLGGQVYAMSGMTSKLHLIADETGNYAGSSANISGDGFAGMTFVAKSSTEADFEAWVAEARQSPTVLTEAEYSKLLVPSKYNRVAYYTLGNENLFEHIVMKYMAPMPGKMEGGPIHD